MKHILITLTIITLFSCNYGPKVEVPLSESELPELRKIDSLIKQEARRKEKTRINTVSEQKETNLDVKTVVYVKGLGDFNQKDVNKIASYVTNFFGYECIVEDGVPTTQKMYFNSHDLDVSQCVFELNRHGVKTIYVTNQNLVNKGQQIRGGTFLRCNTVIVEHTDYDETTVLHEVGHTLGLVHCDNPKCLMAIDNDAEVTMDFCDKCKKRLKQDENI
jgi:archaemetzincin